MVIHLWTRAQWLVTQPKLHKVKTNLSDKFLIFQRALFSSLVRELSGPCQIFPCKLIFDCKNPPLLLYVKDDDESEKGELKKLSEVHETDVV